MYRIDYINHLSTTTKHQPEIPDYVGNNKVSGTSQLPQGVPGINTMYQEGKKTGKEKKEKKRK